MNLSDYVVSVLRTIVPAAWGTALAWLVSVGVLDQAAADGPGAGAGGFLILLTIGLWYALLRLAEPRLPAWLAALLLGGTRAPAYDSAGGHAAVSGGAPGTPANAPRVSGLYTDGPGQY